MRTIREIKDRIVAMVERKSEACRVYDTEIDKLHSELEVCLNDESAK